MVRHDMRVQYNLVLRMLRVLSLMVLLLLLLLMVLLLVRPELVEGTEALRTTVLNFLYMGAKDAFFLMAFGLRSIVDIRIVAFVA